MKLARILLREHPSKTGAAALGITLSGGFGAAMVLGAGAPFFVLPILMEL